MKKNYFTEYSSKDRFASSFKVKKLLHQEQSKWQKIEVYETEGIGNLLLLDEKTMVSEYDEFIYHEVITHVPYMVSRNTEKVLVIGGGDGGSIRELTKHSSIKQIDLVEIDERVIEVSRKYLPHCTSGLDDPRVNILCTDGIKFLEEKKNEYDIIIVDSTDPVDFATGLFTQKFYSSVNNALREDGIMVAQTETPFLDVYGMKDIYKNLRQSFPVVNSYYAPILIYPGIYWTFAFASKVYNGKEIFRPKLDEMKVLEKSLKWYNTDWHIGAFSLSNFHKKTIGL